MKPELNQKPISIANSSGFPLQIATAYAVKQSNKWSVLFEEHPWQLDITRTEGFIDIVAIGKTTRTNAGMDGLVQWVDETRDSIAIVMECKRVRQTAWVFLIPKIHASAQENLVSVWHSERANAQWSSFGWASWRADPASYQSQYCAIPGQEKGRPNLLERTASELIDSVEALGEQEKQIEEQNKRNKFERVYIPVVVTTAQLFVSYFEPSVISLADGSLPTEPAPFSVPYVRFRKSLSTRVQSLSAGSIKKLHDISERTIFVVNASELPTFLDAFKPSRR